jgi:hypothetical protein
MRNYTRPNSPDHVDTPQDWLNGSLIFGAACHLLLDERVGVVVDIKGDMVNPVGDSEKVIVIREGGMIHIDNFAEDLPEGTLCKIRLTSEEEG